MSQLVIGSLETVGFPEFAIADLPAKIDTGAYTGALHCSSIEEQSHLGGKSLSFLPYKGSQLITKDEFLVKYVKSSNGARQKRYFITTVIAIQGEEYEILLSLANRTGMRWPVLIGRRFLRINNFMVDPRRRSLYGDRMDVQS